MRQIRLVEKDRLIAKRVKLTNIRVKSVEISLNDLKIIGPRSGSCHQRPPCRNFDYYPIYGSCVANKTTISFSRLRPPVCQYGAPSSIQTPQNQIETCHACDPGTKRDPITGKCVFCGPNEYSSDGKRKQINYLNKKFIFLKNV